jgi:hypothetical protein
MLRRAFKLTDVTEQDRETSKHLICIVCGYIIREAYSDSCNHVFCKGCYLSKRKQCCPVSGIPINLPIPKPRVDELIKLTNIYCTNKACTWNGQIAEFDLYFNQNHQSDHYPLTHQVKQNSQNDHYPLTHQVEQNHQSDHYLLTNQVEQNHPK